MVLESTMICVDDSDYMRNGDFTPTRLAAMQDAVQLITNAKTRANPESNVGLLTLASSEVLTTLTTDAAKVTTKALSIQPQGELKLLSGLRVAHLALKHRQGKNHKMRIVAFIGSPLDVVQENELVQLGKRLKKEKVNVDIVFFGDGDQKVLTSFVEALNGRDGTASHLVVVRTGPNLTDALVQSAILQSEDGNPLPGIRPGGGAFGFMDPHEDDPELAMAIRVSMEEQRNRQVQAQAAAAEAGARSDERPAGANNEDAMLDAALAMSMDPGTAGEPSGGHRAITPDFGAMTEDEQIAYAMRMSMQDAGNHGTSEQAKAPEPEEKMELDEDAAKGTEDLETVLKDTEFIQEVLEGTGTSSGTVKKETKEAAKRVLQKEPGAGSSKKEPDSGDSPSPGDSKKPKPSDPQN